MWLRNSPGSDSNGKESMLRFAPFSVLAVLEIVRLFRRVVNLQVMKL
jgi:hypothetical protein